MKTYFLLFLFLLICLKDYSQCNTSLLTSNGDSKVFGAALENLYTYAGYNDNGDYAQGSYLVNGHLVVFSTTKNGTLFTQWQLVLTVKAIYFDLLVPRQAMVFFENGSVLDLTASTFKQKEGHQICYFDISNSQLENFDLGITKVSVIDNRQNKQISKVPDFKYILKEQKKCLVARLK